MSPIRGTQPLQCTFMNLFTKRQCYFFGGEAFSRKASDPCWAVFVARLFPVSSVASHAEFSLWPPLLSILLYLFSFTTFCERDEMFPDSRSGMSFIIYVALLSLNPEIFCTTDGWPLTVIEGKTSLSATLARSMWQLKGRHAAVENITNQKIITWFLNLYYVFFNKSFN